MRLWRLCNIKMNSLALKYTSQYATAADCLNFTIYGKLIMDTSKVAWCCSTGADRMKHWICHASSYFEKMEPSSFRNISHVFIQYEIHWISGEAGNPLMKRSVGMTWVEVCSVQTHLNNLSVGFCRPSVFAPLCAHWSFVQQLCTVQACPPWGRQCSTIKHYYSNV